jgi:intron-binding protein aquarius
LPGHPSQFQLLDFSGYLENYLWPTYLESSTEEHTLSIVLLLNEKCKAGNYSCFHICSQSPSVFSSFFQNVVDLALNDRLSGSLLVSYVVFLINVYRNLEDTTIRSMILRYLSLPMWECLSSTRLALELEDSSVLQKYWKSYQGQSRRSSDKVVASESSLPAAADADVSRKTSGGKRKLPETATPSSKETKDIHVNRDAVWLPKLLALFHGIFSGLDGVSSIAINTLRFVERFVELLVDLLSQLPTRRYLVAVLDDMHFVLQCRRSLFVRSKRPESDLFSRLLHLVDFYIHFEVDNFSGRMLSVQDVMAKLTNKVKKLQEVAFVDFPDDLKGLIFSSIGELTKTIPLRRHLEALDCDSLVALARKMRVLTDRDTDASSSPLDTPYVLDLICESLVARASPISQLNMLSLYPTEELLWDPTQLPLSSDYSAESSLALPKLNLQFLTINDYLMRNFTLFRLESAFEIRDDLTDAIKRMGPKENARGVVSFSSWSRMALPTVSFTIDQVTSPRLGEIVPARVSGTVTVDLSRFVGAIRAEWEAIREHDGE